MSKTDWEFSPTKNHELKCWPAYFSAVLEGKKRFELRLDDRGFEVGDFITLREWHLGEYTGRTCQATILYILNLKEYADIKGWAWKLCRDLMPNLVILSIELTGKETCEGLSKNHDLSTLMDRCFDGTLVESSSHPFGATDHDLRRWTDGYYDLSRIDIDIIFNMLAKHVRAIEANLRESITSRNLLQARLDEIKEIIDGLKLR